MGDSPRIVISLSEVPQARPAVQNLPAVQEIRVPALVREDPLEKRMATHSSILAWRIPWTEEPGVGGGRATVHGVAKNGT